MKKLRAEYVHVSVGDIVEAYFGDVIVSDKALHTYKVLEVRKNYGLTYGGKRPQPPTLRVQGIGETDRDPRGYICNGYVKRVIKHSPHPPKAVNVFKDEETLEHFNFTTLNMGGKIRKGFIHNLAVMALSKLPYNLERPINLEQLWYLYMKQKAGLRGTVCPIGGYGPHNTMLIIDMTRFEKWIRKNHNQICYTVAELVKEDTRIEMDRENDYEDALDLEDYFDEFDPVFEELTHESSSHEVI